MVQLKAYEQAKTSAEHAYGKSKALALQRLNSRNSQLLRTSITGTPAATPQPGSAAANAALSTPEQADDRAPFPDDGRPSDPWSAMRTAKIYPSGSETSIRIEPGVRRGSLSEVKVVMRRGYAGQYEEAIRRRKEAELSRAQLQQKIESLKQARNSGCRTGSALELFWLVLPGGGACASPTGPWP